MPCYYPIEAWRGRKRGPSGKLAIVFKKEDSCGVALELPCGRCIGCRLEQSRQWAVRIMHEADCHDVSWFITLTYSEGHLPPDGSLNKRHFQLFCKRLRKELGSFRFFHCGEYGERFERPHYHMCLFGLDFPDKELYIADEGKKLYTSATLDRIWSLGSCKIGLLTFESAAYVARYVCKKITGDLADVHYSILSSSGQVVRLQPEYVTMSRRPGIAAMWFRKFGNEVYPSDEVISRGHPAKPPRYYDKLIEVSDPSVFDLISRKRVDSARERRLLCDADGVATHAGAERLRISEKCARARFSFFKRPIG